MMTPREAELSEQLRQAHLKIKLLEQKIDLLVRRIFGSKSEKLNAAQLELLLLQEDGLGKEPASAVVADCWEADPKRSAPRRGKERAPRLPENLPVVDQVIDPEPVQADPQAWRHIGEEVSEQLDYEPARFFRRRLIRSKYVKRSEGHLAPIIAPLPPSLQERCIAAPGLLAHIVIGKYCDHLPLYRHGTHLRPAPWSASATPDDGALDGTSRRVAAAHLAANANRSHGGWLRAGGRDPG